MTTDTLDEAILMVRVMVDAPDLGAVEKTALALVLEALDAVPADKAAASMDVALLHHVRHLLRGDIIAIGSLPDRARGVAAGALLNLASALAPHQVPVLLRWMETTSESAEQLARVRRMRDAILGPTSQRRPMKMPKAWRGNCPCGKWLVVLATYTRAEPLICGGPCSGATACGRIWFFEDGEARCLGPGQAP